MSRLIDADELERAVIGLGEDVVCDDCAYEFVNLIDAQPTIDTEPVRHGHWLLIKPADIDHNITVECSVCGAGDTHAEGVKVPYCWKCGAKMDEVSE